MGMVQLQRLVPAPLTAARKTTGRVRPLYPCQTHLPLASRRLGVSQACKAAQTSQLQPRLT